MMWHRLSVDDPELCGWCLQAILTRLGMVSLPQAALSDGNHANANAVTSSALASTARSTRAAPSPAATPSRSPCSAGPTPKFAARVRTAPGPSRSVSPSPTLPQRRVRLGALNVHVAQGRTVDTAGLRRQTPAGAPGQRRRVRYRLYQCGSIQQRAAQCRRQGGLVGHVVKPGHRCGSSRLLRLVTVIERCLPTAWDGSWNGAPDNPSATSAINAMARVIGAANLAHTVRSAVLLVNGRPAVRIRSPAPR